MTKFFVSYQQADRSWAEWIAWQVESAGHSCIVQAWDFRPGSNFVLEMDKAIRDAERTIVVLSQSYLDKVFTQPEWAAAFASDPQGSKRQVVPVRVSACEPGGLLAAVVPIDLADEKDEARATSRLLDGLPPGAFRPTTKPPWPARSGQAPITPYFPNDPRQLPADKYRQLVSLEFRTALERLAKPDGASNTCRLLFGMNFPFGNDRPVKDISRCAVVYDVKEFLDATVGQFRAPDCRWTAAFAPHVAYKAASTRWRILVAAVADGMDSFDDSVLLTPLVEGIAHHQERGVTEKLVRCATDYCRDAPANGTFETSKELLRLLGAACAVQGVTLEDLLAEEQKKYRHKNVHPREEKDRRETENRKVVRVFFRDKPGSYEVVLKTLAGGSVNILKSSSWTLVPGRVACSELSVSLPHSVLDADIASILEAPLSDGTVYHFHLVT